MNRIRLLLATLALVLLAACQATAPTAPAAPPEGTASAVSRPDSTLSAAERGGNLFGSGT